MQKTMALALVANLLALHGFAGQSQDGLLADWRFADGCMDLSGHGLNGRMGGFKSVEEPGAKIRCAFNDGSSPRGVWMTVSDSPMFRNLSALTVVFRVKCLPSNTSGWLLYKTSPEGCDFGVLLDTSPIRVENKKDSFSSYRIGLKIGTVIKWLMIDRTQYPPEAWNRFAITVDLKGDRTPRLYISNQLVAQSDSFGLDDFYPDENGNLIGTVDFYEFTGDKFPASGKTLFIGGANIIKKDSFQGYVEEIMLFDKALTNKQIKSIQ